MIARSVTFFVVVAIVLLADLVTGFIWDWLPFTLMPVWATIIVGAMHFLTPRRQRRLFEVYEPRKRKQ